MKRVRFEDVIAWQTRGSKVYFYNKSKSNETSDYSRLTTIPDSRLFQTYDYPTLTTILDLLLSLIYYYFKLTTIIKTFIKNQ